MFIVVERVLPLLVTCLEDSLRRLRSVADYQFGREVGTALFPENVKIVFSRNTGRIRYIYLEGKRLGTMRPTDGFFSLSIDGAKRVVDGAQSAKCFVTVRNDVAKFIAEGGDVFAAHIVSADDEVRAKDEVIVLDEEAEVLAVGRAVLSGEEMKAFKRGVAVKVRRGCLEEG
jgi:predicted RNA-binding protein (TIGR00451 family)